MTSQKHLKQLVRARMEKTGERYTAARAAVLGQIERPPDPGSGWELRGGVSAETAVFANVLANLGVRAGDTPLSEALVLGVGGGLGAGYILWEFAEHDSRIIVLGFQNQWQYPSRWAVKTAERLGLHADMHETGSVRAAAGRLDGALERGLPAIVWIDTQRLGHRHQPASQDGHGGPPVVVYGTSQDGARVLVDDRSTGTLTVSRETLADARARVGSYKHRLIAIDPDLVQIDEEQLRAAVREGIRDQVEHLSARSDSFSLPTWRKWARLTTDTRNRKSWPNVFADRRGIASVLVRIYENAGRGANLRGLYADFLESEPAGLGEVAPRFRAAAQAWDELVETALPSSSELRAVVDRSDALIAAGDAAAAEAEKVATERWQLQSQLDADPPFEDTGALFAAIGEHVAAIYALETEAIAALGRAAVS